MHRPSKIRVGGTVALLLSLALLLSCGDFFVDANSIASIALSPVNPTIALNNSAGTKNTQQFTATATLGSLNTQDVTSASTWTSSAPSVATISNAGLATAVALGSTTISATDGSNKAQTTLTISNVAVKSIAISCASGSLNCTSTGATVTRGSTVQLTATATFTDNTTQDVTNSATWSSSNTNAATVSSTGLVTASAVNTGVANITATFQGTISPAFPVTVQ